MAKSYQYDHSYDPAAPIIPVGLSPSGEADAKTEVMALLDSGADATMIPINVLVNAGARFVEQRQMRGVVGEAITVDLYLTAVHIGNYTIHGIRAIGMASGLESIVGRDVLNQLEINLNGLAHEVSII